MEGLSIPAMPLPTEGMIMTTFLSTIKPGMNEQYIEWANEMDELAHQQDGFISILSIDRDPKTTLGMTISVWRDGKAVLNWFRHPDHQKMIARAKRGEIYSHYQVITSVVQRSHEFNIEAENES